MLLTRWQETLSRFHDHPAIFDGEAIVSFGDLDRELGQLAEAKEPVIAVGSAKQIALATLHGWRDGQPVLPLEKPGSFQPDAAAIPEGVAHLKLTPGNDGQPRTVRFTAAQIAADADRLVAAMGLSHEIPNLATISLCHSYGYCSVILPMLLHGIPIRTVEVPFPAVVAEAWKNHERLVVPAVPSMWRAWHRSGILDGAPIVLAVSAGAPLPLDLEQSVWDAHKLKLHNFYGASECGGISWDSSNEPRTCADDLGTPLPGVAVTLDSDGRFLIQSSSVALGYDACRSDDQLGDGRFLTHDHGSFAGDHLILGSSDAGHINVAGRKLGAARVEAMLRDTGATSRVRVFGIRSCDPDRVDEVVAIVPPGTEISTLRTALAGNLASWEMPRHWLIAPDEDCWKLSRMELRERFGAQLTKS